jgi:hypothetical protein
MIKIIVFIVTISFFTTSCDSKTPSVGAENITPANEPPLDMPLKKTDSDNCGSLKHLLLLLPAQNDVEGAPEIFRGCQGADAQVELIFSKSSDPFYEYRYSVVVLSGHSPYVESRVNLEGSTPELTNFMREAITATGAMFSSQFDMCKNYFLNPMIPDGRNPTIKSIKGLEVCVMDMMDANKEIWQAYAVYDNKVGLKLELTGSKAAAVLTTEAAAQHLLPLFGLFNIGLELN